MTSHHTQTLRGALLLALALTTAACKNSCRTTETQSPMPSPTELKGAGSSYVELTASAVPPAGSGPCATGFIVVAAGNGTQQLLMGSLQSPHPDTFDFAAWGGWRPDNTWDNKWNKLGALGVDAPPPDATDAPEGSDSQTTRLANGDLLLMWNGSTMSPLPNSDKLSWWDDWGTPDGKIAPNLAPDPRFVSDPSRRGYRSAQLIWRFSCSDGKWRAPVRLDGGTAEGLNASGQKVPGYCARRTPWIAGFDRPELYVDPWGVNPGDGGKQRIYVSTGCSRYDADDVLDQGETEEDKSSVQVFMSPDSGATWQPSGIRLAAAVPVTLTSTRSGRLFMFQAVGDKPVLHWSDDQGKSLGSPPGGYDVTYDFTDSKTGAQTRLPLGWLGSNWTGVGHAQVPTMWLARTGQNAVLAVYPAIEKVSVGGQMIERQVAAVVWVVTAGKDSGPWVVPVTVVRAEAADGSVLMPAFIQDDRPDAVTTNTMLYWLETTGRPASDAAPVGMRALYLFFKNGIFPTEPQLLSDGAGWQTKNRAAYKATGDYMKGSFYPQGDTLNFVAVWPQTFADAAGNLDTSRAYARVITLKPVADDPEPKPEAMPGAKIAPAGPARVAPEMRRPDYNSLRRLTKDAPSPRPTRTAAPDRP